MSNDERIIFKEDKDGEPISKDEYNRLNSPIEQHRELLTRLVAWSTRAFNDLMCFGYGTDSKSLADTTKLIFSKSIPNPDWDREIESNDDYVFLYTFRGPIPSDAATEERAALEALKAIAALNESLFRDDKMRIANLGIELGLAVAKAHATQFEKLAVSGEKSRDGYKDRTSRHRKELFQDYIRQHPELIKHITKKKELFDIPELQRFIKNYKPEAIGRWFSEIYPGQFKGGAPKKPNPTP